MDRRNFSDAGRNMNGSLAIPSGHGLQPSSVLTVIPTTNQASGSSGNTHSSVNVNGTSTGTSTAFKAPQHRHAHHLHSIPPREKSTRTLIIDHMLWVHGRTRFFQARAELGMTDRTGGSSSRNYVHRYRPENFEEDEEQLSDGEDIVMLKARDHGPVHHHTDDEEERLQKQELLLARALRLRAEGLEKVVTSMLYQPPPVHPVIPEDIWEPGSSPQQGPQSAPGDPAHPHTLPNGVRLRLALGTVINDLFARQAPPPPYRHKRKLDADNANDEAGEADGLPGELPLALFPLSTVSAAPGDKNGLSSLPSLSSPIMSHGPPISTRDRTLAFPEPSPRIRTLYMAGADPSTANSPPAFRCPRHLHTGCEICVEAKSSTRNAPSFNRARPNSSESSTSGSVDPLGHTNSTGPRRGLAGTQGGLSGWQDGSGVGSGLARPAVNGTVLRRKSSATSLQNDDCTLGAGNTRLAELVPRFMRLSALVAMELGNEAKDYEDGLSSDRDRQTDDQRRERPSEAGANTLLSSPPLFRSPSSNNNNLTRMFAYALRPSREWYMLLTGLLTRTVLQGYLTAGWTGVKPVECLLTVGLDIPSAQPGSLSGITHPRKPGDGAGDLSCNDDFESFDPDGLPSLQEAAMVLFPSLQSARSAVTRDDVEAEYLQEMAERMRRFYDIPESTPDVATHMEDLAWQYPAEPVERAAVRFCEAVAKWRGKPELETYKKPEKAQNIPSTPGGSMTIESLVHSNPPSPTIFTFTPRVTRPRGTSIGKYFVHPSNNDWQSASERANKRPQSPEERRDNMYKRQRQ